MMFRCLMLIFLLIYCLPTQAQNTSFNFSQQIGVWYVDEVMAQEQNAVRQKFQRGENLIQILDSNHYFLQNFLGIGEQYGTLVETNHVLVLSDTKSSGYFWVFQILKKSSEEMILRYIPYQKNSKFMDIRLLRYESKSSTALAKKDSTKEDKNDILPDFQPRRVFNGNSQNNDKPLMTEKIKTADFSGKWEFSYGNFLLTLELTQNGNDISGKHCSGKNCDGNYVLLGSIEGDAALVSIINDKQQTLGKAIIKQNGDFITWIVRERLDSKLTTIDGLGLKKK